MYVRELQPAPYLAIGRDFSGWPAIMLDPIRGATSFRTSALEFLPTAQLEFERDSTGVADCALLLYDESWMGGVFGELMPVLMWGLQDARAKGGEAAAVAYVRVLGMMLQNEASPVSPIVVQGLWAELLLIANATDPQTLVEAWHEDPDEIYDFALRGERLEVKSTRGAHRRHRFSSSQLPPRVGLDLVVASILVQRVAGGATLMDLLSRITARIPPRASAAAFTKALAVIPISALTERAYDDISAAASVAFYAGRDVPTLTLRQNVTDASWTADLIDTRAAPARLSALASAASPLF